LNEFIKAYQPLGEVLDYSVCIEFQSRETPHAHMLLWVNNASQYGVDSDE